MTTYNAADALKEFVGVCTVLNVFEGSFSLSTRTRDTSFDAYVNTDGKRHYRRELKIDADAAEHFQSITFD